MGTKKSEIFSEMWKVGLTQSAKCSNGKYTHHQYAPPELAGTDKNISIK